MVLNNGDGTASASQTRVRIDVGANGSWDMVLAIAQTGVLASHESETETFQFAPSQAGQHRVESCADTGNSVDEADETNNCSIQTFNVVGQQPPPPVLPTVNLTANPSLINQGQTSTLSWVSTNAATCVASGGWSGAKALSGNEVVAPSVTTTFVITCSNQAGSDSDSKQIIVQTVQQPVPTVNLTANPFSIRQGETSILSWISTNAASCSASGGWSGTKATGGSESVSPSSTRTFTIICTGPGGSASDSEVVTVTSAGLAPRVTVTADDTSIDRGDDTRIRWTVQNNADRCTASNSENDSDFRGSVSVNGGSRLVTPDETNTYRVSCSNRFGSDTDSVTVFVDEGDLPTVTIDADPDVINRGESSVLTWRSTNADSCRASGGWSGSKALSGSQTVFPLNTTTYTIRCENENGSRSDSVTVEVRDRIFDTLSASCIASPTAAVPGQTVIFAAGAAGGRAPYSFTWSGVMSGSGQTRSASFTSLGTKTATVRLTDDRGFTASASCSVQIVAGGVPKLPPTGTPGFGDGSGNPVIDTFNESFKGPLGTVGGAVVGIAKFISWILLIAVNLILLGILGYTVYQVRKEYLAQRQIVA